MLRTIEKVAAIACAAAIWLAAAPGVAWGEFGFESLETSVGPAQPGGAVAAGMPVDFTARFAINSQDHGGFSTPDGSLTAVTMGLPPGLIGNPLAVPRCEQADFVGTYIFGESGPEDGCPAASQVGVASAVISTTSDRLVTPVYNMTPRHEGEPARLAFVVPQVGIIVSLAATVRSESDYGIEASAMGIATTGLVRVVSAAVTVWGVPGDTKHDGTQHDPGAEHDSFRCTTPRIGCTPEIGPVTVAPNPELPRRPFLTAPTQCATPLTTTIQGWSAEEPDAAPIEASAVLMRDDDDIDGDLDPDGDNFEYHDSDGVDPTPPTVLSPGADEPNALSGCDAVPFDPSLSLRPSSRLVDSPAGFDVEVTVPQHTAVDIPQSSHVRSAVVRLPEGVSINPAAAHGLVACTDSQLKLGTRARAACPDGSKVGSVEVDVPLLEDPVSGYVVQRPQLPGETFRVAIVASGAGVHLKIPGVVRPDHGTGQIVSIFEGTPQAPFSELRVRFDGGPTAPLATPMRCGTHTTTGSFTPWSGTPAVTLASSFETSWDGAGAGCPAAMPFAPTLAAGTRSALAGKRSPLVVRFRRSDRHQELRSLTMTPPPGLAASLRGVPLCTDAEAAAAACPAGSRIGSVLAGAGAGASPYYVSGDVYLTEGYKGGAFGLSAVVPVKAGPFDLGQIAVRSALHVDRRTAEITVISDRFPRIVEGVPVRARDVRIVIDRPDFSVNPTSCEPMAIDATFHAYQGATSQSSVPFQARECAALAFKPRLRMRLLGRRQTRTGGHPAIRARLRQGPGQAGVEHARVIFPKSLALDPDNANGLCEFEDGIKDEPTCPDSSIVGRVTAVSPLLNEPLRGPVYFVKNVRIDPNTGNRIRTLPMIVAALRGEIAINIRGTSNSTKGGRLVSTFADIPDAPVSRFNIAIKGGRAGILTVTRTPRGLIDLCRKPRSHIARTPFTAQNGRTHNTRTRMRTPCPKANRARKARRRRAAAKRRKAAVRQRAARHRR